MTYSIKILVLPDNGPYNRPLWFGSHQSPMYFRGPTKTRDQRTVTPRLEVETGTEDVRLQRPLSPAGRGGRCTGSPSDRVVSWSTTVGFPDRPGCARLTLLPGVLPEVFGVLPPVLIPVEVRTGRVEWGVVGVTRVSFLYRGSKTRRDTRVHRPLGLLVSLTKRSRFFGSACLCGMYPCLRVHVCVHVLCIYCIYVCVRNYVYLGSSSVQGCRHRISGHE